MLAIRAFHASAYLYYTPTLLDRPSTRRDGSQSFCSGFGTNGFCVAPKGRIVQTYGGFGTDY